MSLGLVSMLTGAASGPQPARLGENTSLLEQEFHKNFDSREQAAHHVMFERHIVATQLQ